MKKGWKIVLCILGIALLLGILFIGVGLITGADMTRIYAYLDDTYHLGAYLEYAKQLAAAIQTQLL